MNGNGAPNRPPGQPERGQDGNQPPKPSGKSRKGLLTHTAAALGGLLIGVLVGVPIGIAGFEDDDTATPAPAATVTETVSEPATETAAETPTASPPETDPTGPSTIPGDGVFLVGEDVAPGTYRTAGPAEDSVIDNCYWERAKDASGELGSIIANDNIKGPGRVTINEGEVFKTRDCQDWELVK